MSFREKMQTSFPRAEEQLDIELQNRHLLGYCYPKGSTIIFHKDGTYSILTKEEVTRDMIADCKGFTIPDRIIETEPIYLDGEPHLKRGVKNRDDRIDKMLRDCGLQAHRFAYRGRLSKQRLNEICNEIESVLKEA